ncbi:MAG: hypothetical protein PHZ00_00165 [Candidatus Peribacteraceae bacterium]|nr:hypothetical protein [Candidatus Peribacteraceae bacterium]
MPRIPDQLLNSIVYLFRNQTEALGGNGSGGTGFFISYPRQTTRHIYVVSNVHVVQNGCVTLRINKKDGSCEAIEIPMASWIAHTDSDDVCVAPITFDIPSTWAINPLEWENYCPTSERFQELNVGVGDDVFMLGRFSGHSGRTYNQPLARFGNIAMMDGGERVKDGRGLLVDAYLIEMRSLPGFSGSPVFVAIGAGSYRGVYGNELKARMMPFYTETIGLIGIDTGHKPVTNPVLHESGKKFEPHLYVTQNSGIAIVAPYYKIIDILELVERH